jgi:hypothetical protein
VRRGDRREGSCGSESKCSQYVNLGQANEETLKKKRKTNKKRELTRTDTADLAKDTAPWQHGCRSSAWNNVTLGYYRQVFNLWLAARTANDMTFLLPNQD